MAVVSSEAKTWATSPFGCDLKSCFCNCCVKGDIASHVGESYCVHCCVLPCLVPGIGCPCLSHAMLAPKLAQKSGFEEGAGKGLFCGIFWCFCHTHQMKVEMDKQKQGKTGAPAQQEMK